MADDKIDDGLLDTDLKQVARQEYLIAESSGNLTLSRLQLEMVPRSIQYLPRLLELDLSNNNLVRFPGTWFTKQFPLLKALRLDFNRLNCLDDILALSKLTRLELLTFQHNPMPLQSNRIYLLEAMFRGHTKLRHHPTGVSTKMQTYNLASTRSVSDSAKPAPVPRCEGFPMLQSLNGAMIMLDEIHTVEVELGRLIRYPSESGARHWMSPRNAASIRTTRKTKKEVLRKQSNSTTFPKQRKNPVLQYEINGTDTPELIVNDSNDDRMEVVGLTKEEMEKMRDSLRLGLDIRGDTAQTLQSVYEVEVTEPDDDDDVMQTFDLLPNDQRCFVREKSKSETSLKDNPFEANTVLENLIQVERSRHVLMRLTKRTVDTLMPSRGIQTSCSDRSLYNKIYGAGAGEQLEERLQAGYTRAIVERNFQLTDSFCKQQVGRATLAPGKHSGFDSSGAQWNAPNRVRNANAIEHVVKTMNEKHEKRMIQALIDSDQQVVEEEVRLQKIQEHKMRMELIARRGQPGKPKKTLQARKVSAWQKRNVLATMMKDRNEETPPQRRRADASSRRTMPYETIELVEAAQQDSLPRVTTKELLLRCADIRKHSRESLRELARGKTEFIESELQWELTRRDPIELLRRKVKASACDGNEVMIGNEEFIYSAY